MADAKAISNQQALLHDSEFDDEEDEDDSISIDDNRFVGIF